MEHGPVQVTVGPLMADIYVVTNAMYMEFVTLSGYMPESTRNYLKHWQGGSYRQGEEDFPVVNISRDDATSYAAYYGKRLPTEPEWQYLAAGSDKLMYPWGNRKKYELCNVYGSQLQAADSHPEGVSPFGLFNMCGNVWEFTKEVHFDSDHDHYFLTLRGGSFHTAPDYWHAEGGAVANDNHLKVHMLGDAMNRYETVGFRCVREVE